MSGNRCRDGIGVTAAWRMPGIRTIRTRRSDRFALFQCAESCRPAVQADLPQDIGSGFAPSFGGSGMNSSWSRSGSFMRPAAQSARAWSSRSGEEETKFQSM